jgi:hypothetical protein
MAATRYSKRSRQPASNLNRCNDPSAAPFAGYGVWLSYSLGGGLDVIEVVAASAFILQNEIAVVTPRTLIRVWTGAIWEFRGANVVQDSDKIVNLNLDQPLASGEVAVWVPQDGENASLMDANGISNGARLRTYENGPMPPTQFISP